MKNKFASKFKLSEVDLKMFNFLQKKLVNPYKYSDTSQKFEETSLLSQNSF